MFASQCWFGINASPPALIQADSHGGAFFVMELAHSREEHRRSRSSQNQQSRRSRFPEAPRRPEVANRSFGELEDRLCLIRPDNDDSFGSRTNYELLWLLRGGGRFSRRKPEGNQRAFQSSKDLARVSEDRVPFRTVSPLAVSEDLGLAGILSSS